MAENGIVKYETAYGMVELSPDIVTKYLKRGTKNLTDQEVKLFIELCKYQQLNPFVGEAYAIKFGDDFQMVVGYDAYKRRAEENPNYMGRESGITVLRGKEIIQKEGACLYPGEDLVGGWCRVYRKMNGRDDKVFKEVSFKEYDKGQANWKTKPATMIEKVAVSQALRAAFPKDYSNMYTAEEMGSSTEAVEAAPTAAEEAAAEVTTISQSQRRDLFARAEDVYGKEAGIEKIKAYCAEHGIEGTKDIPLENYEFLMKQFDADKAEQAE